ncbi:MAG: CatB-related O-acetyltransferase [Acidobacteriota bacterium]
MNENQRFAKFQVGQWSYGQPYVAEFPNSSSLIVGRFCSIAGGVSIFLGGEHRTDWVTTYPFNVLFGEAHSVKGHPTSKGDVILGNDVWIGQDVLLLSGVHIGDGAVIGARSVVSSNIPPYTIAAGNPCRVIRQRFSDELIEELLKISWWNWPLPKITQALPDLLSPDIEAFVRKYSVSRTNRVGL